MLNNIINESFVTKDPLSNNINLTDELLEKLNADAPENLAKAVVLQSERKNLSQPTDVNLFLNKVLVFNAQF